jgi:hypothetical protein
VEVLVPSARSPLVALALLEEELVELVQVARTLTTVELSSPVVQVSVQHLKLEERQVVH